MLSLRTIFSHAIFISLCAAGLTWQSFRLLQEAIQTDAVILNGIFTLLAYNAYRLVNQYSIFDPASARSLLRRETLVLILMITIAFVAGYIVSKYPDWISYFIPATMGTLLYMLPWVIDTKPGWLRSMGFVKTGLLAATWTWATACIPMLISHAWNPGLLLLRFSFILILCILFDKRDQHLDLLRNLGSLATVLTSKKLHVILVITFIVYFTAASWLGYTQIGWKHFLALVFTGAVAWVLTLAAKKERGYYFYYFGVDGLMLFSTIATYIAGN